MSGAWDDRKKALEEEYFKRKEKEAIEKLRARRAAEAQSAEQPAPLKCPKCDGTLLEISHDDVLVDQCNTCNGIWLDAGELERLTTHEEAGFLSKFFGGLAGK